MSATTLPLVAAMLLMAAIEIGVFGDECKLIILILSSFFFVYISSYNIFRYQ